MRSGGPASSRRSRCATSPIGWSSTANSGNGALTDSRNTFATCKQRRTNMTEKNSPSQSADIGEFVISRTFDAPRSLVFNAWTDPEHLMKWWGPKGLTMLSSKLDLRPGGVFLYGMRTPDGRDMWGKWVFREIVTPQRLVFVVSFADADGN